MASLARVAWALTLVDSNEARRAFAAYGGVYFVAAIGWMWLIERNPPDRWDVISGLVYLVGLAIILFGPRTV